MLFAFLRLGCRSFGGPAAHLGYFHSELVERRGWCSEAEYVETLALAQSLPGPASSQVAFALGLRRGGWLGGLAAWVGFTMPSALLLFCFAWEHARLSGAIWPGVLHGLHLVAAAVVAQAVLTMQRSLAPIWPLRLLAMLAAGATLFVVSAFTTIAIIATSAAIGWLLRPVPQTRPELKEAPLQSISLPFAWLAALLFGALLFVALLPAKVTGTGELKVFGAFYRTGALVFGGGHVVLPLLERAVVTPGWVDESSFLEGYGIAQAVPGPLFTFAAYLGAVLKLPTSGLGAGNLLARVSMSLLALVAIFLPGLLLMVAVLPVWQRMRRNARFASSLRLVNASVVGILFAALIRPVGTTAIRSRVDMALALAAFFALSRLKAPPWMVVAATVLCTVAMGWVRG